MISRVQPQPQPHPQPRSYCCHDTEHHTDTYYTNFAEVKRTLGLPARYTETKFAAQLGCNINGCVWEKAWLPLPITDHNFPLPNPYPHTPEWWASWDTDAPIAASQFELPDTTALRQSIAERNLNIRAGIARENNLLKDALFPTPTTEVTVESARGIRVYDGTNTYETNLGELMRQTHWTLNWFVLRSICDGEYRGYTFELGDAAKKALLKYLERFAYDTHDPNTQVELFSAKEFMPIECYNRFDEIEFCCGSLTSTVAHTNLSASVLRRKIGIWDSTSRRQYRLACPRATFDQTFPIIQMRENTPVNYFATYEEAATVLGCSTTTIARWCANGATDIFGCTWTREKA